VCDKLITATPTHNGTGLSIGSAALEARGTRTAAIESPYVNTATAPYSPGRYCFRAEWPGDSNHVGALTEFSGTTECFTVNQHSTTTTTEPRLRVTADGVTTDTAIGTPVAVNARVVDHALITGADGFGTPIGTVEFFICDPQHVTVVAGAEVCAAGNGTALDGNGPAAGIGVPTTEVTPETGVPPKSEATSPEVAANVVGTWCFRATYKPDTTNYTGSGDATHTECFTVQDSSSVPTAQDWLPNDTAVVTATGGTALSGTLTFDLYTGDSCGATPDSQFVSGHEYVRTLTNATSLADRTQSTSNTTDKVKLSAGASWSWKVTFTSSDTSKVTNPSSSSCETTELTIAN